jgi:ferrous iron transport protein B
MPKSAINWLLVGAPNSGKTSLFNQLTGAKGEVMNYPGSTTTTHAAKLKQNLKRGNIIIIDTPGVYGLGGDIPEEAEVKNALTQNMAAPVIFVLDCRFIDHRLQFLSNLLMQGFKCVAYCTHVNANADLDKLNAMYGISFIDSQHPIALKALIYAVENIHLQSTTVQATGLVPKKPNNQYDLDRLFLHPVLSLIFTLLAMIIVFSCAFYIAQPLSNQIESIVDTAIAFIEASFFYQKHMLLGSLLSGGALGLGTLLIFIPQIFLLFVIIFFIQESGYLARAAVVLDPLMQKIGLHGKSFAPLLSGFSCAIPAILLSRTITSKKERLLTILAVPFMICSARVPMYAMCVSLLFSEDSPLLAGVAFSFFYIINICLGIIAAGFVNKFLDSDTTSYFMLELPPYKLPSIKIVVSSAFTRVFVFLKSAGPVILGFSLIVWFITTFPNYDNPSNAQRLDHSYASQLGHIMEPVFQPMGTDWRVGTAILSSFAAREVFVSSITLLLGNTPSNTTTTTVFENLKNVKKADGSLLFSYPSIIALLVFFMFALQCSSTTITTAKETGSWKIAFFQFIIMNGLAYTLSVITYQILSRIYI